MEATPGIGIQGKRLSTSRLASNSQSITQLELPRSRLSLAFPLSVHEVVPNPYQKFCGTVQQLRFVDALISKYLAHAKPSPLKAWMSMQKGLRSSENFHRCLLTGTFTIEDQRTSKAKAQAEGNPSRNRHICRRCCEPQPAAHPAVHLAHLQ